MPGLLFLLCLLALFLAAACRLRQGGAQRRAVLVIAPSVSCAMLEGMFRPAMDVLLPKYSLVAIYGVAAGEQAYLCNKLAANYRLNVLSRAEALHFWRSGGADFWRLCPDGYLQRM